MTKTVSGFKFFDPKLQAMFDSLVVNSARTPVGGSGGWGSQPLSSEDVAALNNRGEVLDIARKNKGRRVAEFDPEVRKLLMSVAKINKDTGRLEGVKGEKTAGPSGVSRFFDVLSRPLYTVANAVDKMSQADNKGKSGLQQAGAFFQGAWKGLAGEEKTTFSDVIQHHTDVMQGHDYGSEEGKVNPIVKAVGGLTLDIALDPTTYVGIGAIKDVKDAGKIAKAVATGDKLVEGVEELKNVERVLLTGEKVASETRKIKPAQFMKDFRTPEFQRALDVVGQHAGAKAVSEAGLELASVAPKLAEASMGKHMLDTFKETASTSARILSDDDLVSLGVRSEDIVEKIAEGSHKYSGEAQKTFRKIYYSEQQRLSRQFKRANKVKQIPKVAMDEIRSSARFKAAESAYAKFGAPVGLIKELTPVHAVLADSAKIIDEVKTADTLFKAAKEGKQLEIIENLTRIYNAETTSELALRVGKKKIGLGVNLPSAHSFDLLRDADNVIGTSLRTFDKMFRTGAGMPEGLQEARLITLGRGASRINARARELVEMVGHLDKTQRRSIFSALKTSAGEDYGHLDEAGQKVKKAIEDLFGPASVTPDQIKAAKYGSTGEYIGRIASEGISKGEIQRQLNRYGPHISSKFPLRKGDDWLKSWHDWDDVDPAEMLWHFNHAFEQALAYKSLKQTLIDTFGVALPNGLSGGASADGKFSKTVIDALHKSGYREVRDPDGWLKNTIFQPEIATGMEKLFDQINQPISTNVILRGMDRIQGLWKQATTVYSPAFHVRNMMGDVLVSYYDDVSPLSSSYPQAIKVLKAHGGLEALELVHDPALTASRMSGTRLLQNKNKLKDAEGRIRPYITKEQVWALYNKYGLRQSYTQTEFAKVFDVSNPLQQVNSTIRRGSEFREDFARLAHFIDRLKRAPRGLTLDEAASEAAAIVRKYHFDYTDFTHVERNVFSRMFPFYKWTRKALPLMMEQLLFNTGKAMMPTKFMRAISQLGGYSDSNDLFPNMEEVVPVWLRQNQAVPLFARGNNTVYLDPSNVNIFQDSLDAVTNPKERVLGMLSPLIRWPYETKSGESLVDGRPLPTGMQYWARQATPTNTFINRIPRGQEEGNSIFSNPALLNWLTGFGLQENTVRAQVGELKRQQDVASAKRKKARIKYESETGARVRF